MNRSYRKFLVMVAEEFVMQSDDYLRSSPAAKEDYERAVQWLKNLPEEICPEITDEQLSKAGD